MSALEVRVVVRVSQAVPGTIPTVTLPEDENPALELVAITHFMACPRFRLL